MQTADGFLLPLACPAVAPQERRRKPVAFGVGRTPARTGVDGDGRKGRPGKP